MDLIIADIQYLPFRSDVFETIISSEVLDDTSCPQKALSEFHRTLKKNCYLLMTVPWFYNLWHTKCGLAVWYHKSKIGNPLNNIRFNALVNLGSLLSFLLQKQMVIRGKIVQSTPFLDKYTAHVNTSGNVNLHAIPPKTWLNILSELKFLPVAWKECGILPQVNPILTRAMLILQDGINNINFCNVFIVIARKPR